MVHTYWLIVWFQDGSIGTYPSVDMGRLLAAIALAKKLGHSAKIVKEIV